MGTKAMQVGLPGVAAQRGDTSSDACFTPPEIVMGATMALGGRIDTDPCWHPDSFVPDEGVRYDGRARGDGLVMDWRGSVWMNPAYSDPLPWVRRFRHHCGSVNKGLALVKLDPSTRWWAELTAQGDYPHLSSVVIGLVRKRIRFLGEFAKGGTPNMVNAFVAVNIARGTLEGFLPIAQWVRE